MMHVIQDYKGPNSLYSQELTDFIEKGTPWENPEAMQKSMSLEDKGWNVKVCWGKQYIDDTCIGLGLFADENIPNGTIIRTGRIGANLIIFNSTANLPNLNHKPTVEYLKHYAYRCACHVKENPDNLVIWIPGNSVNHTQNSNALQVCWKEGMNIVSTQEISKGDMISLDYRGFGDPPKWFLKMLETKVGDSECTMQNDFAFAK